MHKNSNIKKHTLMFLINIKNDIPHIISMLIFDIVLLNIKKGALTF